MFLQIFDNNIKQQVRFPHCGTNKVYLLAVYVGDSNNTKRRNKNECSKVSQILFTGIQAHTSLMVFKMGWKDLYHSHAFLQTHQIPDVYNWLLLWVTTHRDRTGWSINWSDILRNLKLFRMFCILPGVKRKKTNKKTQITEITERFWSKQFQNNFLITAAFHPSPWNDLPSRTAGCRKDSRQETRAKTYFRLFLHVPLIEFARWMLPFSIPVIIQPCALVLSYIHSENPRAQRNLSLIMPLGASLSHIFIVHYHYTSCTGKA